VTITAAPPAEPRSLATAVEVLFKEARHRRRRRWLGGVLAFALMAVPLIVGFGGSSSGGGTTKGSAGSRISDNAGFQPPGAPSTVQAEMLDYFIPTNGSDFASGYRFITWESSAMTQMTNRCLAAADFPPTAQSKAIAYGGDNTEFPDLSYLSEHGFLATESPPLSEVGPAGGLASGTAQAYRSMERRCRISTDAAFQALYGIGAGLMGQWMNVVSKIDAGPQFQGALVGWQSCTRRAGIDVTTISDFFTYADWEAENGGSAQNSVHLGQIYARCLGQAEAVRDRLRQKAKVSFLAAHTSTTAELTAMLKSLKFQSER
jgi:hypothetical protein